MYHTIKATACLICVWKCDVITPALIWWVCVDSDRKQLSCGFDRTFIVKIYNTLFWHMKKKIKDIITNFQEVTHHLAVLSNFWSSSAWCLSQAGSLEELWWHFEVRLLILGLIWTIKPVWFFYSVFKWLGCCLEEHFCFLVEVRGAIKSQQRKALYFNQANQEFPLSLDSQRCWKTYVYSIK